MAEALFHRGPDEDGYLEQPGLGFASRRLSIVGLADGRQPIGNEDGSVQVVFNGELFDYPEVRAELEGRGHVFRTHCDTELLPHLWEEQGEGMFERLRGQFALALWDERADTLLLARDRFGVCPLHWAERDGWLLFASEVKGLLASGMVEARPDPCGLDHVLTMLSLPGPRTCFAGVQSLLPGHALRIRRRPGRRALVTDLTYWDATFPDAGREDHGLPPARRADELEALLARAVRRRLRADVPVAVCLSGGVDSCLIAAMARRLEGRPLRAFSVQVAEPGMDESAEIAAAARGLGVEPVAIRCGRTEIVAAYPDLVRAAEAPVVDTSCAAVLCLARLLHEHGYKAALTGQGADECLAGYLWFKVHKLLSTLDVIPGLCLSNLARRAYARLIAPHFPWSVLARSERAVGGPNAYLDFFALPYFARFRFYSRALLDALGGRVVYEDLVLNRQAMRRWHVLNRGLYLGAKTLLAGMLLSAKGDLAGMAASVELRHPFLDEDVYDFCATLPPSDKLRGLRDKYLLRGIAERWLPRAAAWRRKTMFQAPGDSLFLGGPGGARPAFVGQLLSPGSLRRTGYFDPEAVRAGVAQCAALRGGYKRASIELGLAGVVATQLWHHTYIDGELADLPTWAARQPAAAAALSAP
jgi:asparagine synthase (glutamine-hydrolysing)